MNTFSRRQFLRLTGVSLSAAAILAACGPGGETAAPAADAEASDLFMNFPANNVEQWSRIPADHEMGTLVTEEEWYAILGEPPAEGITIAGFQGGWGEAWIDAVIASLEEDFPGIVINKDFDPRIWEKMKPRLVAGEVPDWNYYVLGPWGGDWKAGVEENLVIPGDFLMDLEAYGVDGQRVGELVTPGALEAANGGLSDGQWSLPLSQSVYGIYYNATLFEENGWSHPADLTWEEFEELMAEIAASGIAPMTYPGKYPGYVNNIVNALKYKKAGPQALCDADNLVEGAQMNPDFTWAIEQVQEIFANGYIFEGSDAMTHTESQQIFVDGKAAMIPNGSWMPNEQRSTTPEDFRMKFSAIPAPADAKGASNAVEFDSGAAELQIGNGQNPLWGMEVMRRIYSPTVQAIFAEEIGSPMAMINVLENADVSAEWESAADAIEEADGNNIVTFSGGWYPEMGKRYEESLGDIWTGKMSAEDAQAILERGAEEVRSDDSVTKYSRECA